MPIQSSYSTGASSKCSKVAKCWRTFPSSKTFWSAGHHRADRQAVQDDIDRVYGYFPRLRGLTKRVSGYLSGG